MTDDDAPARVDAACAELTAAGEPVSFAAVADRARIGRATVNRRPELRALVEEHRARARDAHTPSGLTAGIHQPRAALDALAAKVRRHEEALRRLTHNNHPPLNGAAWAGLGG